MGYITSSYVMRSHEMSYQFIGHTKFEVNRHFGKAFIELY